MNNSPAKTPKKIEYHVNPPKAYPKGADFKRLTLADAVPDISQYWDAEKNGGKEPKDFPRSSSEKVYTKCPVCGEFVLRTVRFTWEVDENGIGHVIHCRTCGKTNKENSLVQSCPDILNYWDYEKNTQKPEFYPRGSGKKIYLNCPKCDKLMKKPVCETIRENGNGGYYVCSCNECGRETGHQTKVNSDRNLLKQLPDIVNYWDYEKNGTLKPEDLTVHSKQKVYTICPNCGKSLYRSVFNSVKQDENGKMQFIKCQRCAAFDAAQKCVISRGNLAIDICPDIVDWWDYESNPGVMPDTVAKGSNVLYQFKCPKCSEPFRRSVHRFISVRRSGAVLPVTCPHCGYASVGNPENNLTVVFPDIVHWWNYEKNAPYLPEQFTKGSQFKAYLTCPDCGIELYHGLNSVFYFQEDESVSIKHIGKCRKYRALASENNLLECFPDIIKWWDYNKNGDLKPEHFTLYSPLKVHLRCPDCGHEAYRRVCDAIQRFKNDDRAYAICQKCSCAKALTGYNDLATKKPELLAEWSPNNSSAPTTSRFDSDNRVLWICPTCNGEYRYRISERSVGDDTCPYCRNKKVLAGFNDLATTNPGLASEWSPNNEYSADSFTASSSAVVLWACPTCNGEYRCRISERSVGDDTCPYCRNKKVLAGFNDLATVHPKLMDEWLTLENTLIGIDPKHVSPISEAKVWWKCDICHRKYLMSIADRVMKQKRKHTPCCYCNGLRQKRPYFV